MYKGFTIKFSNISIRLLLKKKFSNIWWDLMDPSKDKFFYMACQQKKNPFQGSPQQKRLPGITFVIFA
jgi:hypothetical protein